MLHFIGTMYMDSEAIIRKIYGKLSADDRAVLLIVGCFSVIGLARLVFGGVPWYFLAATMPMFFAAFLRPRAGLYAIIILTVLFERFFTLEGFQFGRDVIKFYPIDAVLLGTYASVLAQSYFGRIRFSRKAGDIFLSVFFFLATAYFAGSLAGFGDASAAVAFSTWKNYVFYGALFFALPMLLRDESDLKRFVRYFLGAAAAALVFLFIGFVRGEGLWTEYTPLSTEGVRVLAFPHAFYFSLAFLGVFVAAKYRPRNGSRSFVWIAMILWAIGILGSLMRHLWIGMAAALLFAFCFLMDRESRRATGAMTAIAAVSGAALLFAGLFFSFLFPANTLSRTFEASGEVMIERIVSIGDSGDESISWRGATWGSAFKELSENPVFGSGFGMHVPVESGDYRDFVEVRNIHNSWLALLVQMGAAGVLALVSALGAVAWRSIRMVPETPFMAVLRVALLTLAFYQGIALLAQPYLETNLLGIFFWMMFGLMRTALSISEKKERPATGYISREAYPL